MTTEKLTASQALVKFLANQMVEVGEELQPLFGGVFAIFGHGNVAGLGEALYGVRSQLPTFRAHNEQGMAHAAVAFAKAHQRKRMMACTTSIGPGATNLVTAAALAHVNRLPVLMLPGDTFGSRAPDPVLQQLEVAGFPGVTANDCLQPVSRYFDKITRPEQLISSLPASISVLTDPANCGPATLAISQDVQAESFAYPVRMFEPMVHRQRRQPADAREMAEAVQAIRGSKRPLIIAGGGVLYGGATDALVKFAQITGVPVSETQAGKGAVPWDHPCSVGAIGVTGTEVANELALRADVVVAIGTRLQDFTTASRSLFSQDCRLLQINISPIDVQKHGAKPVMCDAKIALEALTAELHGWSAASEWRQMMAQGKRQWEDYCESVTSTKSIESPTGLPSDAQVLGAVNRVAKKGDTVVCAAGGLPGELHKLWKTQLPGDYHVEYGFSCMGYEIAGGLGVKMARPSSEVFVLVGDGSYMMLNSELATSVMLGHKIIVVLLDNKGYGCINRLQNATGNQPFNNLLEDCEAGPEGVPEIDFAAHARAMGAEATKVANLSELEDALRQARSATRSHVIVIDTDPYVTSEGGHWWDVAVPEESGLESVQAARRVYEQNKLKQAK